MAVKEGVESFESKEKPRANCQRGLYFGGFYDLPPFEL